MKLRIQGNSVRMRLGPGEAESLHQNGALGDALELGPVPDLPLRYGIVVHEGGAVWLRHRDGELRVGLPADWARELAAGRGAGFDVMVLQGSGVFIRVQIECDLSCAHPKVRGAERGGDAH